MEGKLVRTTLACFILAVAFLRGPYLARAEEEIVISGTGVLPAILRTTTEERVRFVNRSGKVVHVEFPEASDQHHVFQFRDEIWAVFHRPGRHPYAVHLSDGGTREFKGVVEVAADSLGLIEPRSCGGITITGTCLER